MNTDIVKAIIGQKPHFMESIDHRTSCIKLWITIAAIDGQAGKTGKTADNEAIQFGDTYLNILICTAGQQVQPPVHHQF